MDPGVSAAQPGTFTGFDEAPTRARPELPQQSFSGPSGVLTPAKGSGTS